MKEKKQFTEGKGLKLIVYVLSFMLITFPTCQLLRSLLNFLARLNAVSISHNIHIQKEKNNIIKRKKKIEKLSAIYSL